MNIVTLVLQITVILAACRLVGDLFIRIGQPRVNGEMFAGVILGPSFLGWLWPSAERWLFPPASLEFLNAVGQLGVVLFMFLAGIVLNVGSLLHETRNIVITSIVSIGAPFALAFPLSRLLYPRYCAPDVGFVNFFLIVAAAMTITAFPMMAKFLLERNVLKSRFGTVALAASCIAGIFTWCALAYVVILVKAQNRSALWLKFSGIALLFVVVILLVKPGCRRFEELFRKNESLGEKPMAAAMVALFFFSYCAGYLGLHPLFGSFLLGTAMPKEGRFVSYVTSRLDILAISVLLPLYLAFSGLRTDLLALRGWQQWAVCFLIVLIGVLGKVIAPAIGAWAGGMKAREAAAVGSLLNMRGLICLIVLNVGLELKVLSTTVFSMMVVMAVVNTILTPMLFKIARPGSESFPEPASSNVGLDLDAADIRASRV